MSYINPRVIKSENVLYRDESLHIDDRVIAPESEYLNESFVKSKKEMKKELEAKRNREMEKLKEELERFEKDEKEEIIKKAEERVYNRIYSELDKHYKKEYRSKLKEADQIIKSAHQQRKTIEENISKERRDWIEENKKDIIQILISSTRKIVGETMEINAKTVSEILSNTIKEVDDHSKKIWVSVSEEANEILEKEKYEDHNIQIIVDPSLKDLDIVINSDDKMIDGTIQKKIERLEEVMEAWLNDSGPF